VTLSALVQTGAQASPDRIGMSSTVFVRRDDAVVVIAPSRRFHHCSRRAYSPCFSPNSVARRDECAAQYRLRRRFRVCSPPRRAPHRALFDTRGGASSCMIFDRLRGGASSILQT
jgi:hypothetical protein